MPKKDSKSHSGPIGEVLRTQRIEGLQTGLREMAKRLAITPAHLTDIEKGRRTPSEELLVKMAEAYKMPVAELRAGWSRPDAIVEQVASQDALTAAKVPEFLRTARGLTGAQWDQLIRQAKRLSEK